ALRHSPALPPRRSSDLQFAILLEGQKHVSTATQSLRFVPGDIFLITRRCRIDVVNVPDPHTGRYLSAIVPFCAEALAAARTLWRSEEHTSELQSRENIV